MYMHLLFSYIPTACKFTAFSSSFLLLGFLLLKHSFSAPPHTHCCFMCWLNIVLMCMHVQPIKCDDRQRSYYQVKSRRECWQSTVLRARPISWPVACLRLNDILPKTWCINLVTIRKRYNIGQHYRLVLQVQINILIHLRWLVIFCKTPVMIDSYELC